MIVNSMITETSKGLAYCETHGDGTRHWYLNGQLHRDNDLPAIERPNRQQSWYQHGKLHRTGLKPAFEGYDGYNEWYKYNRCYGLAKLVEYYRRLESFAGYLIAKIRMRRLKQVRWIHGELLCMPPRGSYPGGQDYHKMIDYFMKN